MSLRSKSVAKLVRIAGMEATTLGEAFFQIGIIAHHWPSLRPDERRKLRAAALHYSGLIEQKVCRRTGTLMGIYDSIKQGIETPDASKADSADYIRGHWQLKYTIICEKHSTCVCVASLAQARRAAAEADFCDDCWEFLAAKEEAAP